jgi:hypothetical protein
MFHFYLRQTMRAMVADSRKAPAVVLDRMPAMAFFI